MPSWQTPQASPATATTGLHDHGSSAFVVVDTGGFSEQDDAVSELVTAQTLRAVEEADCVLLMVDGQAGINAADEQIAQALRRFDKPLVLVVNKLDHDEIAPAAADFHALGVGAPHAISATHRRGISQLVEAVLVSVDTVAMPEEQQIDGVRVAVVGRPNTGKSTLINRLLGEERLIAHEMPGTTHDALEVSIERRAKRYTLIDTAGVRRRAKVVEQVEKFSVVKTLQAIASCNVAVVMMDARAGITDQDIHVLGVALEQGRALVVAINKWDNISAEQRSRVRQDLERKLSFADYAPVRYISAMYGSGIGELSSGGGPSVGLGKHRRQHAAPHPAATRGGQTPPTTARAWAAHQASLRAPRRVQPALVRHTREPDTKRCRAPTSAIWRACSGPSWT